MTLEEAIKHLERHYILHFDVPRAELDEAAKLGIEALKAVLQSRRQQGLWILGLLPGETEE